MIRASSNALRSVVLLASIGTLMLAVLSGCSGTDEGGCEESSIEGQCIALTVSCEGADSGSIPAKMLIGDARDMRAETSNSVFGLLEEDAHAPSSSGRPFDDEELRSFEAVPDGVTTVEVDGPGEYLIYVDKCPVNLDGSTYALPGSGISVKVTEDVLSTEAKCTLQRIPIENMSKEQLEDSAATLIAFGHKDEAKTVLKFAESAPSAEELIAKDPANATRDLTVASRSFEPVIDRAQGNTVSESIGDGTNHDDAQDGPSQRPSDTTSSSDSETVGEAHSHVWTKVVDEAAYDEPIYSITASCDQCGKSFTGIESWMRHLRRGSNCSTHTDSVHVAGTKHHDESNHMECSICGARR